MRLATALSLLVVAGPPGRALADAGAVAPATADPDAPALAGPPGRARRALRRAVGRRAVRAAAVAGAGPAALLGGPALALAVADEEEEYVVTGTDISSVQGEPCTNNYIKELLKSHGKVRIVTYDGAHSPTIYYPGPTGVPEGSKLTVQVTSTWSVNVFTTSAEILVATGQEISFEVENGAWKQVEEEEYVETGTDMSSVQGEPSKNDHVKELLNSHGKVRIETYDGMWIGNIHYPDPTSVSEGSKLTVKVMSTWGVNVFTTSNEFHLATGQEISFEVENGAWKQVTGTYVAAFDCANCGGHSSPRCLDCGWDEADGGIWHGEVWCNGECQWLGNTCADAAAATVNCGGHSAATCAECGWDDSTYPKWNGEVWCNGECQWTGDACVAAADEAGAMVE